MSPAEVLRANEPVAFRRTEVQEMLDDVTEAIGSLIYASNQENAFVTIDSLKAHNTQMALQSGLAGHQNGPIEVNEASNG